MSEQSQQRQVQANQQSKIHNRMRRVITLITVLGSIILGFVFFQEVLSSAALFILILIALVMAHEAGHFFTAKAFGVYVHEFGLGFPPRIGAFKYGETEYSLNWLPIGGFVRLEGEEQSAHPRSLSKRPRWQRLIILAAGAVVNLVLPIFLFAFALSFPHQVQVGRALISVVIPESPAAVAGLQEGDIIYTIAGRDTLNVAEASRYVRLNVGRTVDIRVRRSGEYITIPVEARRSPPEGQGPTGISIAPSVVAPDGLPFTETIAQPPWESIPNGFRQTWDTLILAQNEVRSWFGNGGGSGPQFAGPIGIGQTVGEVARSQEKASDAVSPLLELAALLSINLGILNLLPLPMLDGGRIFFLIVEVARGGKRIAPDKEAIVHMAGFILFIGLALVITFIDINRIINGESIFR
tara:strand:- start:8699 stop:9928 length:1230 start_codon:yes stop_codon:yes gene_type:complete